MTLTIRCLRHSDNLTILSQAKDFCSGEVQKISKKTVKTLKRRRCDEKLESPFEKTYKKALSVCIDPPELTRKRRTPPRIEESLRVQWTQDILKTSSNCFVEPRQILDLYKTI